MYCLGLRNVVVLCSGIARNATLRRWRSFCGTVNVAADALDKRRRHGSDVVAFMVIVRCCSLFLSDCRPHVCVVRVDTSWCPALFSRSACGFRGAGEGRRPLFRLSRSLSSRCILKVGCTCQPIAHNENHGAAQWENNYKYSQSQAFQSMFLSSRTDRELVRIRLVLRIAESQRILREQRRLAREQVLIAEAVPHDCRPSSIAGCASSAIKSPALVCKRCRALLINRRHLFVNVAEGFG